MKPTVHMIGNAHIDPVWLWNWQEGFHESLATFRSALDRMVETEDFTFVASSAALYAWVEQNEPGMFAEIQQRVAEGRWLLVGGWWIEPDCNIPSGESFVRQGLVGQRYFQEKFGQKARVAYNVDSFGHNAMLPQIMKKSGLDYYIFMRPMPHEKQLPERLFWWEADDGSRLLTYRLPLTYGTPGGDLSGHVERCLNEFGPVLDELMCFFGVGNHGGGPTRESIASILRLQANPDFPAQILFGSPLRFFETVEGKGWALPVVHDDLQHHASGCYAAHSGIKRWNRQAENRLLAAEKWSAAAWAFLGRPYPQEFERAWKNVLFNQFHDILAGTSLETAYADARDQFGEAMSIAGRALNAAHQAFSWQIGIEPAPGVRPLVAFNSLTWPVTANVELEFDQWEAGSTLIDDGGNSIPFQAVAIPTTPWRQRLSFIGELPALGYRTYRLFPPKTNEPGVQGSSVKEQTLLAASDLILENRYFRLEIDPQTGGIRRLFEKRMQVELFSEVAGRAVVYEDLSDTWSHDVLRFNQELSQFEATQIELVENGPVKAVVRAASRYGKSELVVEYTAYASLDQLDLRITVNWQEHQKLLKLRFPLGLQQAVVTTEIPYGTVRRKANGDEEPCQNWVDVSGYDPRSGLYCGLSLLNDGKYSLDAQGGDIGLTVLRSPAYAHHFPATLKPDGQYRFIDQGEQVFTLTLLPHSGSWQTAGTVQRAVLLNQPPVALQATVHPAGRLPLADSMISTSPENILVMVLKQAEDGPDLVLRAYESRGEAVEARIELPKWGRVFQVHFAPWEIKTLRIPSQAELPVIETNMLEE